MHRAHARPVHAWHMSTTEPCLSPSWHVWAGWRLGHVGGNGEGLHCTGGSASRGLMCGALSAPHHPLLRPTSIFPCPILLDSCLLGPSGFHREVSAPQQAESDQRRHASPEPLLWQSQVEAARLSLERGLEGSPYCTPGKKNNLLQGLGEGYPGLRPPIPNIQIVNLRAQHYRVPHPCVHGYICMHAWGTYMYTCVTDIQTCKVYVFIFIHTCVCVCGCALSS